ncbi:hypothetical protein AAVH_19665 [Aphelenchoides avenae]|nr:hypothetical protein AAVH_19665 [Aphelenchus avenae]
MLPNESFLQVLHFADYKSLVFVKLAGIFFADSIHYNDMAIGAQQSIRYEHNDMASLAGSCREIDGVIGPHDVATLTFFWNSWMVPDVGVIFEAAPPLKFVQEVVLRSINEGDS